MDKITISLPNGITFSGNPQAFIKMFGNNYEREIIFRAKPSKRKRKKMKKITEPNFE